MKTLEQFEHEVTRLVEQDDPSLAVVKKLLEELTELINDPRDWEKFDYESKCLATDLQAKLKEMRKDLEQLQKPNETTSLHDPQAEELMEQAERNFYSGHYQEAMKYYDQVLHLEPKWERAKEHSAQADEYMTEGHIPEPLLPAEVASLFGKAQSAARVMRLKDAMNMLESAREILSQNSITKWSEGSQFAKQLQISIDAEESAKEAENLFFSGLIDDAIEKVELASGLTGYPKYKFVAERYRHAKNELANILMVLLELNPSKEMLIEAVQNLNHFRSQYGEMKSLASSYQRIERRLRNVLMRSDFIESKQFDEDILITASSIESEEIQVYSKLKLARKRELNNDFAAYVILLEELLFQYPMNEEVLLRYELATSRLKKQQVRTDKRKRQESQINHYSLHSTVWFFLSVVYALAFLITSIYIISQSLLVSDLLTRLVGLLSILPTLATKLVYDQSIRASDRAQSIYKEVSEDESRAVKEDGEIEDAIRRRIYGAVKSRKNNSKPT